MFKNTALLMGIFGFFSKDKKDKLDKGLEKTKENVFGKLGVNGPFKCGVSSYSY
ncbi:hypothetical protein N9Y26_00735 [bacterium]|nr:hypothetical protein [bacterium]